jgi:hypothetical protein
VLFLARTGEHLKMEDGWTMPSVMLVTKYFPAAGGQLVVFQIKPVVAGSRTR